MLPSSVPIMVMPCAQVLWQAVQRRRHGVPGKGVVLAAEFPPKPPDEVMHRHQRLDPGELHADADPRTPALRDERARWCRCRR